MAGWEEGCLSLQEVTNSLPPLMKCKNQIVEEKIWKNSLILSTTFDRYDHLKSSVWAGKYFLINQQIPKRFIWPSQIYEDCPAFLQPCLYKADYRRWEFFWAVASKQKMGNLGCRRMSILVKRVAQKNQMPEHGSAVADLLKSCWTTC